MKRILALTMPAALLAAAPVLAQPAPGSDLLGAWAVDVSRLPVPPEQRPKSVTFTFSEVEDGKWHTVVEIVSADGSVIHSEVTHTLDGALAPVTGSPEADMVAVRVPAPGVLVMALSKGGVPASMRVFAVQPDGNTQTETAVYYNEDGLPVIRVNYFTRLR